MRHEHIQQNESWLRDRVPSIFIEHAPPERHAEADDYARRYDLSRLSEQSIHIKAALGTGQILANTLVQAHSRQPNSPHIACTQY